FRAGRLSEPPHHDGRGVPAGRRGGHHRTPHGVRDGKVLKQRVIIENKPGAAGATGNAYVANAKPDGYTLLMALSSISVIPEAERLQGHKPPYELNQLAPIALISAAPVVLVVRKDAPR